ncbi:MAG: LysR family transcriptional regulator [Tateyamaria sp.]|uniref:helix-turn-helix domain-containing protein n=1 Tax=Tateyamaria sp. TaxID=1929288 RepID=UPI00329C2B75
MNESSENLATLNQPLLFEMIRSYTTLAETLNLSHAVAELNSTRQTVRRHIAQLEAAKGEALFTLENRQYHLTEAGRKALPEALDLLARGRSWLMGQISHRNGLENVFAELPEGRSLWMQQRPMSDLWSLERPLLKAAFRAWALSDGELESDLMRDVRPYFMVYRDSPNGWICIEIGDESSYVTWSGWAAARSSLGRNMHVLPGGDDFVHLMISPFEDAALHKNTRLDHIYTQMPREPDGPYFPIFYQRLLLPGQFPDGTFALISVVDRHHDVEIIGLDEDTKPRMPDEVVMKAATI